MLPTLSIVTVLTCLSLASQATAYACLFSNLPICTDASTAVCKCPSITDTCCDFSTETCSGKYSECIPIKMITEQVLINLVASTQYVATVSTYSDVQTETQFVTDVESADSTTVVGVTETITETTTITRAGERKRSATLPGEEIQTSGGSLEKRVVVGTSTRVVTATTDCASVRDPKCTETVQGTSTVFTPTTTTVIESLVSTERNLATAMSTTTMTEIITEYQDAETVMESSTTTEDVGNMTENESATAIGTSNDGATVTSASRETTSQDGDTTPSSTSQNTASGSEAAAPSGINSVWSYDQAKFIALLGGLVVL